MENRFVYLKISSIDFPYTAIISIIHRMSGLFLFLSLPILLYFFKLSLLSESSFFFAKMLLSKFYIKSFFFLVFLCFGYHMFFGLKHIIMDFGFFFNPKSSKIFAILFLFLFLSFVFVGILL